MGNVLHDFEIADLLLLGGMVNDSFLTPDTCDLEAEEADEGTDACHHHESSGDGVSGVVIEHERTCDDDDGHEDRSAKASVSGKGRSLP